MNDPNAFPPEFREVLLPSSLTALGGKHCAVFAVSKAPRAGDWSGQGNGSRSSSW